ncbi:Sporulation domain-containing protein [Arthrobacter crystallopoietes BAB-32]|uniref:Sporulation domain-containing protein n=1 Tax=Arthrobacter crystallopoietes BAB-32 TaxID=1246476 RepID=N1V017_9MICC|nr:phosphodiester glycosidase family protein [Arthrobacter crystallopoietes]EMY35996.1 Sporulation domain-containing protein [Arthrobacter crystallopoietes BAB-32]
MTTPALPNPHDVPKRDASRTRRLAASRTRRLAASAAAAAAGALVLPLAVSGTATAVPEHRDAAGSVATPAQGTAAAASATLDLGADDLPETRTETQLAPGVTHTAINRGIAKNQLAWTVEVKLPSGAAGVADAAVADEETARRVAAKLAAAGIDVRVEHVVAEQLADSGGDLGYRVRAGKFSSREEGAETAARVKAAGYASSVWYTGWDGDSAGADQQRGPWNLEVLTIDPKKFDGGLAASFGSDLEQRETTSELAAAAGALAAVNGGFFVFNSAHGAEGDPAGAAAYAGEVLSESVGDRPSLVIDGPKASAAVERTTWRGTVAAGNQRLDLDGINRVPGLIRNCGGADDMPTNAPKHDATCTDANELVAFTGDFGPTTPAGPGLEVVLDSRGKVTAVNRTRGTAVPEGGRTIQATGTEAGRLAELAGRGIPLKVDSVLAGESGKDLRLGKDSHVVNGGPLLLQDGRFMVTAARDGMVHADNPGMFYGWVHQRNPRTIAGTDAEGRLILVTADGRQTSSLGLRIYEAATVAKSLGMVDAVNLDGGGATTMVAGNAVLNTPSNEGGAERAVGDALLVLPARK